MVTIDISTISLLGGIITCIVGIATFIVGMNSRAKKEGVLEQKINQAIEGIEEIKGDIKSTTSNQATLALLVQSHEEQIKTLFRSYNSLESRLNSMESRLNHQDFTEKAMGEILSLLKERSE